MSNRNTRNFNSMKKRGAHAILQFKQIWILGFRNISFSSFIRCRLNISKMEIVKCTSEKRGRHPKKFTYRCDMGAHAHIVPQLFIVMTSTISNYSLIYIYSAFLPRSCFLI